ncbi:hypothetical protein HID58_086737 [Brassica napus]|uniref:Derlin n=1 Tax=Brassica napus TaxID=3708 RepID=A0ABQ7XTX2_BRANA|nr:hypothetical protein HID58_086737 [Brassica napus]
MAQGVEEWYKQMPIITRSYLTAAVVTTVGCSLDIISPYSLYLNPTLVVKQHQYWRLVTNFLYFRKMGKCPPQALCYKKAFIFTPAEKGLARATEEDFEVNCLVDFHLLVEELYQSCGFKSSYLDFMFHMFFLARYCKLLEENSFRGKTADFLYMLLFGATVLTGIVLLGGMIPYLSASFAKIIFLSNSLTFMMVYVWSKQNPYIHMSFLGLFTFTAAYLPWVLLGFSVLVGASPWVDLLGMIAGHAYYFLSEVYPRMTNRRPLKTPAFLKALFADEPVVVARPENVRFDAAPFDEIHQD